MAIKRPDQMDFSQKTFTMIISGSPGIGKTTLALSAPDPILFDLDRGISRVRAEHRTLTVEADAYKEMLADMESDEYKAAKTVVLDTVGSLIQLMQPWAKKQEPKAARDGRAMFGVIKREFDRLTHQIRSIDKKNCIIVFHTTEVQKGDTIIQRLSCEGSAKDIVWTPADLGCYMHMMGKKRLLGFAPTEEYFAKSCYGIGGLKEVPELKPGEPNDYLTRLFNEARASINDEMTRYNVDRPIYEEAMSAGRALIAETASIEALNETVRDLGTLTHALTSRKELLAALNEKAAQLGAKWDKEAKAYVQADAHAA